MELSLIGLQNAGKTSLVNVIASGAFHEDMIPTVGFNMRKVTRGAVTIKLWDLGGQVITWYPPSNPYTIDTTEHLAAGNPIYHMHCLFPTCYSRKIQTGCIHPGLLIGRQSGKLYHIDSVLDECNQAIYIEHAMLNRRSCHWYVLRHGQGYQGCLFGSSLDALLFSSLASLLCGSSTAESAGHR